MEEITKYLIQSTTTGDEVKAWSETVNLPTYPIGEEEKNPIFLEKRVYQGSSGSVYPYPVVEKIEDEKVDKEYQAVFLENRYLKIMILPQLGGRVQMAYDKMNQRHFVYYNQVVKPALVGLTGPWISGGIEFNWPQHHRPSTFLPTDCMIEENSDGSKTVWCSELERMFRTKGMAGFTLYRDKAYLEIKAKVYNRTHLPQTFLWWANPAVVVNSHYYSVFPPDVNAVFDHGKRDVSTFPIATGTYYKQDYSAGVDISRYENIPVPTSYMAVNSKYDFVGGYEEDKEAGMLHVADHHINAGKKQWTWGNGDFGRAWDRNLTDEDGPYIELMTGMYCDNQPDFSWLQPYEEKSWTQYFMPYAKVGKVKNASKDALLNIERQGDKVVLLLYVTSVQKNVRIVLNKGNHILHDMRADLAPESPLTKELDLADAGITEIEVAVYNSTGRLLVGYTPEKGDKKPVPEPAKAAKEPKDIASIEQLYLTGLHLEQYRHATYSPMDYYLEALHREPSDARCNNAAGLWLMRRGRFDKAQPYFEQAIKTLTERNPNPSDGEPYFNLGCALKYQGKDDAAYDALFKATWNDAEQASGYYHLALIDCKRGNYDTALEHIDLALIKNWHNHKARQLKCSLLRKRGDVAASLKLINESLQIDKFNMGCRFEQYLLGGSHAPSALQEMCELMHDAVHSYIEYSLDFAAAGLYHEAIMLLQVYTGNHPESNIYPIVYYAMGYYSSMDGDKDAALAYYKQAMSMSPDYCFPNKLEELLMLKDAMTLNPADSKAGYYLGNFRYAARQYDEAIGCWEKSLQIDNNFPTLLRNLALACYNKRGNKKIALEYMERAFGLNENDARILMELDQLYKKLRYPHKKRLELLESHIELVDKRDDLSIERITLYNLLGEYEKAKQLISSRKFHPWEGGEGKITGQYLICRLQLAHRAIERKEYTKAIELLNEARQYPPNLGEGKLAGAEENDIDYYLGCAYEGLGDGDNATCCFEKATTGSSEPAIAFFYNDQQPDKIFYQGLAWRKLGNEEKARDRFNKLIESGTRHLNDHVKIDYFAVSLPDLLIWEEDLNDRNLIYCNLVMGLGHLGLGETAKAKEHLDKVKELDNNCQGVYFHLVK